MSNDKLPVSTAEQFIDWANAKWSKQPAFDCVKNGDTALVKIGTQPNGTPIIWKVPAHLLEWAKSQMPVFAKLLPDLAPPERRALRDLKAELKRDRWKLFPAHIQRLEEKIVEAEATLDRVESLTPVPR